MSKKLDTKDLIKKIEKITKERITQAEVVSLAEYRDLVKKPENYTLLVVEDDETMRLALKRIFESEGYKVLPVADGTELSSVFDENMVDLIVMDIGLPWINGFELAKLLKEHDQLKTIPLIFISGKTSELDIKRGFDVGADDYIKKPFDVDKIKKTVQTLLKLSK